MISDVSAYDNQRLDRKEKGTIQKCLTPGQLRRRNKRQQRKPLIHAVVIPFTKGEFRLQQQAYTISHRYTHVIDHHRGIHIAHWPKGVFSSHELEKLSKAALVLRAQLPTQANRRNSDPHLGYMCTMSPAIYLTRHSLHPAVDKFLLAISSLLDKVFSLVSFY